MSAIEAIKALNLSLNRPFAGKRTEAGMSLIEILIVMSLVGGIMVMLAGTLTKSAAQARVKETELAFGQLRSSMQMYRMAMNKFPTTEQGLVALIERPSAAKGWRGPYIEPELLKDAWGTEIKYESDGRKLQFLSAGDDQEFGTPDDVAWPAEVAKENDAH